MPTPAPLPPRSRAEWLTRLGALLAEAQPGLPAVALSEDDRLDEDLGLDSLAFEALFSALRRELPRPIDALAWLDALDAGGGRVAVLLDLIEAEHAAAGHA